MENIGDSPKNKKWKRNGKMKPGDLGKEITQRRGQ